MKNKIGVADSIMEYIESGLACKECKEKVYHRSTCSRCQDVTIDQWKSHADKVSAELTRYKALFCQWLREAQRWEGKFAILRHENNKLRKANEALRKKLTS